MEFGVAGRAVGHVVESVQSLPSAIFVKLDLLLELGAHLHWLVLLVVVLGIVKWVETSAQGDV